MPVFIHANNVFRNGELKDIEIDNPEEGIFKLNLVFKENRESIVVTDAIESPFLEFMDINGDNYYDLIVRTDLRPNNGSQIFYISDSEGFSEFKLLSRENGTFVFNPYKKVVVFNSKEDCCDVFSKVIFSFNKEGLVVVDKLTFDYLSNKGEDANRMGVSIEAFESY